MDNAPGHFQKFTSQNVTVKLFPPNVTIWKQPCDLGIICALKKYKYLYLKVVLDFYSLSDQSKKTVKEQSEKLHRGAAGVAHEEPANLFETSCYIKKSWQDDNQISIQNSFIKADLGVKFSHLFDNNSECTTIGDILNLFKDLKISVDKNTFEEYVQMDE